MKEFEWFEWFEWFGPSPIEPFNSGPGPFSRPLPPLPPLGGDVRRRPWTPIRSPQSARPAPQCSPSALSSASPTRRRNGENSRRLLLHLCGSFLTAISCCSHDAQCISSDTLENEETVKTLARRRQGSNRKMSCSASAPVFLMRKFSAAGMGVQRPQTQSWRLGRRTVRAGLCIWTTGSPSPSRRTRMRRPGTEETPTHYYY